MPRNSTPSKTKAVVRAAMGKIGFESVTLGHEPNSVSSFALHFQIPHNG